MYVSHGKTVRMFCENESPLKLSPTIMAIVEFE